MKLDGSLPMKKSGSQLDAEIEAELLSKKAREMSEKAEDSGSKGGHAAARHHHESARDAHRALSVKAYDAGNFEAGAEHAYRAKFHENKVAQHQYQSR